MEAPERLAPTADTKAATVLQSVTANYAAFWRNFDKLTALQEWVKEQQKVK